MRVALSYAFVEPFLNLLQQPRHPILAELYPLRELPCRLKPRDVLWRIRNATDRFQLLLRYDLLRKHRTTPSKGSVDAPLRLAAPVGGLVYQPISQVATWQLFCLGRCGRGVQPHSATAVCGRPRSVSLVLPEAQISAASHLAGMIGPAEKSYEEREPALIEI